MTFEKWLRYYKKKITDFADIAVNFDDSDMKEAFNAGAKEPFSCSYENGAVPMWHDLRKNPDDLPPEREPVLCRIIQSGSKYTLAAWWTDTLFDKGVKQWWYYNNTGTVEKNMIKTAVIAWCEFPKFEEE